MVRVARFMSLLVLASTFFATPKAHADDMGTHATILVKLDDEWSKLAGAKDERGVASYYAPNALVYPPNDVLATGRDAAEKVWASYFALPAFSISWKTTHASVSRSGEMGYTTGTYQDSYTGSDGKTVNEKGKYVCVWAKQKDGQWKAVQDIWNSDSK
jgi:ketosteroid isomerase-like protein